MKQFSLKGLNQLEKADFVSVLADIFEHSPWVPDGAYDLKPFKSIDDLHSTMVSVVTMADESQQLDLIRAHPDLAGKAARSGNLTASSTNEQAGAGLDSLTDAEYDRFHELNNRYKEKFDFPFILAVKGHDKHSILEAFETRLGNGQLAEQQTALGQIAKIAKFRLDDLLVEEAQEAEEVQTTTVAEHDEIDVLHQDRLRVMKMPWLGGLLLIFFLAAVMSYAMGWGAHAHAWVNLLIRWIHILYGIAWIGASFYFIFLENALERENQREDLAGSMHSLHGGGIYYLEKFKTAPNPFPKTIHWFKWDAYFTWLTGFLMMITVYYINPQVNLLPAGSTLPGIVAVGIGIASMVATWLIYVNLSKTKLLDRPALFGLIGLGLITLAAYLLTLVFSGRGMYIHIGAMLGTIMVGNVIFVIIPSQKKLLKAIKVGESLDPAFIKWVQLRSRHNNYLTLPVLFAMISNHYPMTYGHNLNWLILILLFIASVALRHSVNVTEKEHHRTIRDGLALPYLFLVAALIVIGTMVMTAPKRVAAAELAGAEQVSFMEVSSIIYERCTACHATVPSQAGFTAAPAGVLFESAAHISTQSAKIKTVAVDSEYMPPGNLTGITEEERQKIGLWIAQGANTN